MRLLLVEDDPMIGEAVQDLLRAEHYAVDWARDGDAADTALRDGLIAYDRRHGWRGPYAKIPDMSVWEEEFGRIAQRRHHRLEGAVDGQLALEGRGLALQRRQGRTLQRHQLGDDALDVDAAGKAR